MQKPTYDNISKASNEDKRTNASYFDHKKLLNNTKGDFKLKMFNTSNDNASKRDVASEIDYSDHKSIATSVTLSQRSK